MAQDKFLIDGQKLSFHPHRVAQWLDAGDDWEKAKKVYPIYIEVSPMGACNHRCTFCAVDYIGYKAVSLDTEILCKRLSEMAALGVKSERRLQRISHHAAYSGLDVAFTTNGVLLDRLFMAFSLPRLTQGRATC